MSNFLSFEKMITPAIIKVIFWVGVVMSVLSGIGMIITGLSSFYGSGMNVFTGLLTIIIGPLLARVYCEILMIFFKIHESLKKIENRLSETSQS